MAALCCPAAARRAATNLPSVTNVTSGTPGSPDSEPEISASPDVSFPKSRRLLRSREFREVYEKGMRIANPYFAAFCLAREGSAGPRVGFTVPRALGKAVRRNRIKRRLREVVRHQLWRLGPRWDIVFNPRRLAHDAPIDALRQEVEKLFLRCGA